MKLFSCIICSTAFSFLNLYFKIVLFDFNIISINLGCPGGLDRKESTCNAGDLGLLPGLGRSPGVGHGNPF